MILDSEHIQEAISLINTYFKYIFLVSINSSNYSYNTFERRVFFVNTVLTVFLKNKKHRKQMVM